jgi:hypothetical protein
VIKQAWKSNSICIVILLVGTLLWAIADGGAQQALPASCDRSKPETCLYTSDLRFKAGMIEGVSLVDAARNNYEIKLLIRYPRGATAPRPVVIWHHGGLPSAKGASRSAEWGEALATAGYVVVHPSRTPIPDPTPFLSECRDNGFRDPDECGLWVTGMRYGAQNTHFLIKNFRQIEGLDPALAGLLDPSKIVVAGHSAGSDSVLAAAGAWQQWVPGGKRYQERNDAPIAFLATGVHGPQYAGFHSGFQSPGSGSGIPEHSFHGITRPFLFITGVGDETGEPPEARVSAWLTAQTGKKTLMWNTSPEAVHETMDIHKCDTPLQANHCRWIASAGVAFLDAVVRGRAVAEEWLRSDALEVLSGNAIELHHR